MTINPYRLYKEILSIEYNSDLRMGEIEEFYKIVEYRQTIINLLNYYKFSVNDSPFKNFINELETIYNYAKEIIQSKVDLLLIDLNNLDLSKENSEYLKSNFKDMEEISEELKILISDAKFDYQNA